MILESAYGPFRFVAPVLVGWHKIDCDTVLLQILHEVEGCLVIQALKCRVETSRGKVVHGRLVSFEVTLFGAVHHGLGSDVVCTL